MSAAVIVMFWALVTADGVVSVHQTLTGCEAEARKLTAAQCVPVTTDDPRAASQQILALQHLFAKHP